ncbi:MAG: hypothetical protein AABZ06_11960 [Bdellovibrionota bacterium]
MTCLCTTFIAPSTALGDFSLHHWENEYVPWQSADISGQVGYYTTSENFDSSGSLMLPSGLDRYKRVQTDLTLAYGVTKQFSIFARMGWENIRLDHNTRGGAAYGFGDQSIGWTYRALENLGGSGGKPYGTSLDVQIQMDFPTYNNKESETNITPYLGDGSTDLTAGAFLTWPFAQTAERIFMLTSGAGYTYRTAGFSSAIPWSVSALLKPTKKGFSAGASVLGVHSLGTDNTTILSGSSTNSSGTGGSFITNAINPVLITVRGEIGYQLKHNLALSLSLSRSVIGQYSPSGTMIAAGIKSSFGDSRPAVSEFEYKKLNKGFLNYSLEGRVLRANDRLQLVKIDKGSQDGVEVGQVFDIFTLQQNGVAGESIARAQVTGVKSDEAALRVTEYFQEVLIDEGFVVKRLIQ